MMEADYNYEMKKVFAAKTFFFKDITKEQKSSSSSFEVKMFKEKFFFISKEKLIRR